MIGDQLTHVGNYCVTGKKIEEIVRYTTADEGSSVELKLIRGKKLHFEAFVYNLRACMKGDKTITAGIVRIFKQGKFLLSILFKIS